MQIDIPRNQWSLLICAQGTTDVLSFYSEAHAELAYDNIRSTAIYADPVVVAKLYRVKPAVASS